MFARFSNSYQACLFILVAWWVLPRAVCEAQTPVFKPVDSAAIDTVVKLQPLQIRASIFPRVGANVGSGIPARTVEITPSRASEWTQSSLPTVLASQPGISVQDEIGQPNKLSVSMRGYSAGPTIGVPAGLSVFLDGVRQNEPDEQEVNFDLLPMESVERLEILSGSGSLLGPNSLGGGINLITALGGSRPTGSVELGGGSWGGYSANVMTSGPAGGSSYYGAATYETEDGWRRATSSSRYNAIFNSQIGSAAQGIVARLFAAGSSAETAGSLPESEFKRDPRTNFTPGDFDNLAAQHAALSGRWLIGRGTGLVNLYLRHSDAQRFNVNQGSDPNVRGLTDNRTLGGTVDWRTAAALNTWALSVRGGVDAALSDVKIKIYAESLSVSGSARRLTTKVSSRSGDFAPYFVSELRGARLSLSAGARYDVVSVPLSDELRGKQSRNLFRRLSPRAGLTLNANDALSFYGSVGASFRAPAILELGCADAEADCPLPFALGDDPPLKPVRTITYEVGGNWTAGRITTSASGYVANVRNEIFFVGHEDAPLLGYFQNLDRTRRLGADVTVHGTLPIISGSWDIGYARTSALFETAAVIFSARSDTTLPQNALSGGNRIVPGDHLPLVPENQLKVAATVKPHSNLTLTTRVRWVGAQWMRGDEANETRPLPAFMVADAHSDATMGDWIVSLAVSNLSNSHRAIFGTFNENQQTGELERFLTPMNARAIRLSVTRLFGERP